MFDLISSPPTDDNYGALRTRLTDTFGLSEQERASRLLHFRPLGDSKPSTLMDEMLAFLGDHPPCLLFNQLFLECLPADIRIQLVDAKIEDHRALAKLADVLWECRDASMESNAVHKPPPTDRKQLSKTFCFYIASSGMLRNSADHRAV